MSFDEYASKFSAQWKLDDAAEKEDGERYKRDDRHFRRPPESGSVAEVAKVRNRRVRDQATGKDARGVDDVKRSFGLL